jgi:hypothetical protein
MNVLKYEGKNLPKIRRKYRVEEYHKTVSGSLFKWATSSATPSRKLNSFNCKLADSTAGVASVTYPKPIEGPHF